MRSTDRLPCREQLQPQPALAKGLQRDPSRVVKQEEEMDFSVQQSDSNTILPHAPHTEQMRTTASAW